MCIRDSPYTALFMRRLNFAIFRFFDSSRECPYIFSVVDFWACPRISAKVGISKSNSNALVAKVWRSVGFLELFDLLRIEDMDFPLETAKAAIFPESVN